MSIGTGQRLVQVPRSDQRLDSRFRPHALVLVRHTPGAQGGREVRVNMTIWRNGFVRRSRCMCAWMAPKAAEPMHSATYDAADTQDEPGRAQTTATNASH